VAIITKPPEELVFESLAEVYDQFHALLIGKDFRSPRGAPIIIVPHHFFHLVKLQKGIQTEFDLAVEEDLIRATIRGLGDYKIDVSRAQRLSWVPDVLRNPMEILEPNVKKTADEEFLREYNKAGSAFRAALLRRESGGLRLITCMPRRKRAVEKLRLESKRLWP